MSGRKKNYVRKVVDPCDLAALALMDLLNHDFHNHATQCLPWRVQNIALPFPGVRPYSTEHRREKG